MSETADNDLEAGAPRRPNLAQAIREVRNDAADRADVVVDIREGQLTRLELLADELRPVFAEVPQDDPRFDFAVSSGLQPRLWIDAVAHVALARDRRTYRFLLDTRIGRSVLAETADLAEMAEKVTRYIAERVVERRRMVEGEVEPVAVSEPAAVPTPEPRRGGWGAFFRGLGILVVGALAGAAIMLALAWQRFADLGLVN